MCLLLLMLLLPTELCAAAVHDYCIVGAGPGGLQLGHLMLLAGRQFVIYERNAGPGSFFSQFPIHRKLISLNKRHTGRSSTEFNLRHDWNSLLGNDDCASVPTRTTERFPHADVLVEYLRSFAQPQEEAGRIAYDTQVQLIRRGPGGEGFRLELWSRDQASSAECSVLVMANGLWTVNTPDLREGAELLTGYETLPSTGESMEGQSVAVLGMGNSAFEVANAAADYANYVHIWPTREESFRWPHTSWESRYVGSLRAIRTGHLDAYLLKSLDGLPLADGIVAAKDRLMVKRCYQGKQLCLFHLLPNTPGWFRLSFHNELDVAQMVALEWLRTDTGITIKILPLPQGIAQSVIDVVEDGSGRTQEHWLRMPGKAILVPLANITESTIDRLMDWRRYTGDTLGRPCKYRTQNSKHSAAKH